MPTKPLPKVGRRKRDGIEETLLFYHDELYRALVTAKSFERQRLTKKLQKKSEAPKAQQWLNVLMNLDLRQTARTQLQSSLLRWAPLAASEGLPEDFKKPASKPALTDEEIKLLHNITSQLVNGREGSDVIKRATEAACEALGVRAPETRGKRRKAERGGSGVNPASMKVNLRPPPNNEPLDELESLASGADEGTRQAEMMGGDTSDEDTDDEAAAEEALAKWDALLGDSADEIDPEALGADALAQVRRSPVGDDMSISGSPSTSDHGTSSREASPATPARKRRTGSPRKPEDGPGTASSRAAESRRMETTFLPTLMGGYISGSESASDVDVAPAKKRRGQRQRQAAAERKYGTKAKHLKTEHRGAGRDDGWDPKRGAVDRDGGRRGKKRLESEQSSEKRGSIEDNSSRKPRDKPPPQGGEKGGHVAKDAPLHPSWAAAKRAKEATKALASQPFQGKKIVFD